MKTILNIFICSFVAFNLFGQHENTMAYDSLVGSQKASLAELTWLEGHWTGEAFGGICQEIWAPALGGSMMGMFKLVSDNEINFYELMTISEVDSTIFLQIKHFDKTLNGWEEKDESEDFKFIKADGSHVYFDQFTFEKISDQEINIYVVIGDGEGNSDEVKFNYKSYTPE